MKILVIEDDNQIRAFMRKGLLAELFIVDTASSGKEGVDMAQVNTYDAVVLDFHLGDVRGDEVSKNIRKYKPSLPILVLSVELDMDIKIDMLSVCDDYMTKPFAMQELVVRLRALGRRGEVLHGDVLTFCDLTLDTLKHVVFLRGEEVSLRNKEFGLLEYFMKHPDIVLSREMILENVWDMNADPFTNTVDVHVRLLRKKIHTKKCEFIQTVPKRGYVFRGSKK